MRSIITLALFLVIGTIAAQNVSGQDYIGYVAQLQKQLEQKANQSAYRAVQLYRQQTGDYSTPDQQVFNYLVQLSRQQNPGFYQQLRQREQQFQRQQANYRQYANSMLDNSHNAYMQRSNYQHQQHMRYVREGIWEQSYYTNPQTGQKYQLPNNGGGRYFRAQDGSVFYQDPSGQYYRYDQNGWRSVMNYSKY